MADKQPPNIHEGAADAETTQPPKSAEDRKAASALASLDAADDASGAHHVDHEAASKAMQSLKPGKPAAAGAPGGPAVKKDVRNVRVDPADVALLVDELELTKVKATELLKSHEGDAVRAMRAFVNA